MMDNLTDSLLISLTGMGLVFLAILLLWGLMTILVRVTSKKEPRRIEEDTSSYKMDEKRRAAAAAVAVAMARQTVTSEMHEFPLPPTALVSAWHAVLRSRMLNNRGSTK